MKKFIISVLIVLLSGINAGYAQPSERSIIAEMPHGKLVLERTAIPDGLAFNDRITLEQGDEVIEVFESEGRAIQQVLHEDLDGDGIGELLIQMDLGGSGGFKEFALLQNIDGNYTPIWEESGFCAGNAIVEDREGSGRPNLYIEYADTEVTPVREKTAVFTLENGELKRVE